ncbi:MAG TPA: 7TM diverse intracellular signaling domain-containing protein [Chryseosolibacter sp.]
MKQIQVFLVFLALFAGPANILHAQKLVAIRDSVPQYIFSFSEIEYLEDATGSISLEQVTTGVFNNRFVVSETFSPENYDRESFYWYRIKIHHPAQTQKEWQLEFFDQTIDQIDFYYPDGNGSYEKYLIGDQFPFHERILQHKNFLVHLPDHPEGDYTYYFRLKSRQQANILVVLRATDYFFNYALDEYFFFGVFYGMILVFCFYNLLMFAAVRERQYLYYILYLLGIGLYEMSADGIAFQYLWPDSVGWNQYATGFSLFLASTASLFFAGSLLNLKKQHHWLQWVLLGALVFRALFLVISLTVFPSWFYVRFIEVIPFGAAFFAGIYCLRKGYRPARFMVVGYSFLFLGILIKAIQYLQINWLPLGDLTHYSLGFSFIMEMMFLSFAISDKIKVFRLDTEIAQQKTIEQLQINQRLKDNLNFQLEEQVKIKTRELTLKSEQIQQQNFQLSQANQKLARQAEEIAAMNALLSQDNLQLKHDVEHVTEARILSRDVDFEEFSLMYPDDDSCLKFLANIKWHDGFACSKCSSKNFGEGRSPYSRRCSRCGYDESVTAYTLLQNSRLPINKAFYMIFLVYSSKGNISSHKLSQILNIRQSTCWSYSSKIKKAMKEKHKNRSVREGWDSILLSNVVHEDNQND